MTADGASFEPTTQDGMYSLELAERGLDQAELREQLREEVHNEIRSQAGTCGYDR